MFDIKEIYNGVLKIEQDTKEKTIMKSIDDKDRTSMTFYHVMPGIDVVYNKFGTRECIEPEYTPYTMNMIEINHCRQGRYGCVINENQYVYLGEGEIEANILGVDRIKPEFPLGFYDGIAILLDIEIAKEYLQPMFPDVTAQIEVLKEQLIKHNSAVLIKKVPELEHIFNELYNVNADIEMSYIKLKVIEILLILQIIPFDREIQEKVYFGEKDRAKIKAIHKEIINNLDKKITLKDLALKYNMSLTTLKNCFKEVYGMPYYNYLKHYKMHKAVHYLEETDLSISEIASKLGYDNTSKFISAFKTILKCTPREYKNKNVLLEHLDLFGVEIE